MWEDKKRIEKLDGCHEYFLAWLIENEINHEDLYHIEKNNLKVFEILKERFKDILLQENIGKISFESQAEHNDHMLKNIC